MLQNTWLVAAIWATSPAFAVLTPLSTTSTGAATFVLGNSTYYAPATPIASACFSAGTTRQVPLTVFQTNASLVTADTLSDLVQTYLEIDDVWSEEFLKGAIAIPGASAASWDLSAVEWMKEHGVEYIVSSQDSHPWGNSSGIETLHIGAAKCLNPGPYLLSMGQKKLKIQEAYLLHQDKQEAFLFGVVPVPDSTAYTAVDAFVPSGQDAMIPVPSRLYSLQDQRPLAGVRIGLKDIYDLEGIQTGGGSRSYAQVFPPTNQTALPLQKLLDLGAVVIGKTKTSQFAHGADPWQFLDIHYPWNPRGDGYLTAASSSSGSAAAIAAYDWLDITLGSDTRGSVRKPAALVGSYGIRPSWGVMSLSGVIPLADEMDTPGFFARDPALFQKIARLWFADGPFQINETVSSMPKKLLYPVDYFPLQNDAAQQLFESFMDTLNSEFGIVRTPLNFTSTLRKSVSNPQIANLTAFQLNSNRLAEYISYNKVGQPLEEAWAATFPGSGYPPLDPNPRAAFRRSVNLTQEDYEAAVEVKNEFKDFFLSEILKSDPDSCSKSLMILDMGTGGLPSYREQALNSLPGATSLSVTTPGAGPTMPSNYLASTAGCPQIGIPIGQVTYYSYISLQEETMPISVDLVAARGCDGLLLDILNRLTELGVSKTVKTGKVAF
ncbi:amidase signature domain-containing protein [Stachybotrys elegans]|uniref:Amidase signature domain-containing protein n=1 Tax=Stachybotrys elegans TaxID=80388 RepID=A0A8K0SMX6_9HYPO|nr:amidase signature domain-containing protein [Stachybotrys elegans]